MAAADINQERREAFGRRWEVASLYDDYRDMLASERLDIVSVCTPTRSHAEVVEAVVASGVRGLFMEKPVASSLRHADAMVSAAQARGVISVVNHVRTFDPYYRRVRTLIADGVIGDLHHVMVHWHEGMSFGGSHLFDLLRFLTDSEVSWVFGHLDEGDGLFAQGGSGIIVFRNGVEVFVDNRSGHAAPRELDIVGARGRIRIGDSLSPELYTQDFASPFGELVKRPFPGSVNAISGMQQAVSELIDAIERGAKPASDLTDGRANLEISVAFHLAHQTGAPVHFPVQDLDLVVDDPWGRAS